MNRFKGLFIGAALAVLLSAAGGYAAKGVMTYIKDTAAAAGQSVIFDLLSAWNSTYAAPFMVASNATPRSKTTGNATAVGYQGETFIGFLNFSTDGVPTMNYYTTNGSGRGVFSTYTAAQLNSTNYGPFSRFLPGSR